MQTSDWVMYAGFSLGGGWEEGEGGDRDSKGRDRIWLRQLPKHQQLDCGRVQLSTSLSIFTPDWLIAFETQEQLSLTNQ